MRRAKQFAGLCGIAGMFGGWAYSILTSPAPKPAWLYLYAPAVACIIVGAAVCAWWAAGDVDRSAE